MLPLWTRFCGVWLLASAAARGARAVALVSDRARSAAGASVRVRGGWCWWCPLRKLFSVEHGVVPRAPTDALQLWRVGGYVRRAYFATEIYMNLYYLITVVNKIIVFLNNNCIS